MIYVIKKRKPAKDNTSIQQGAWCVYKWWLEFLQGRSKRPKHEIKPGNSTYRYSHFQEVHRISDLSKYQSLKYVGLILSLFLIRHLYLGALWQGFEARMDSEKASCFQWDWPICSEYRHHSWTITTPRPVFSKRERESSLWPLITSAPQLQFWNLTKNLPDLKLPMRYDNSQSDSMFKKIWVRSAKNRAA